MFSTLEDKRLFQYKSKKETHADTVKAKTGKREQVKERSGVC
jgi:hypothetical protein